MSFAAYWPYYLRHHSNRANRLLHFLGWLALLFALTGTLVTGNILVLLLGVATAYVFAWTGHLVFEREIPDTFRRPVLANIASLRMFALMATGRLGDHLSRHGIVSTAAAPDA